jgi:hypothetical protein
MPLLVGERPRHTPLRHPDKGFFTRLLKEGGVFMTLKIRVYSDYV